MDSQEVGKLGQRPYDRKNTQKIQRLRTTKVSKKCPPISVVLADITESHYRFLQYLVLSVCLLNFIKLYI